MAQEKELREKYHDVIYNTAEKIMRTSQNNQLKLLRVNYIPFPQKQVIIKIKRICN